MLDLLLQPMPRRGICLSLSAIIPIVIDVILKSYSSTYYDFTFYYNFTEKQILFKLGYPSVTG